MIEEPQCSVRDCRHYRGLKEYDAGEDVTESFKPVCAAFPDGIPFDIAYGDNRHLEVVPGQKNDIVYEKQKK